MGYRGQVLIEDVGVYLYTHWGASELTKTVQKALAKKWRWDDPEYLARIIFCEMVKGDEEGETGYGIGNSLHGDVWKLIVINCENKTVFVKSLLYQGEPETKFGGSFEDFIASEFKGDEE